MDRGWSSKSVEVLRVWEIYDDRLQFVKRSDALLLTDCLMRGDVTAAWFVWSAAAEEAVADAFRLAGGSVPDKGLVLGRGCVRWRAVTLGDPRIRRARGHAGDAVDAGDVFLYRDSSTAPLLDLRRRLKVVLDVLDALIRHGVSWAWSVELTSQWDRILRAAPVHPVTWEDFDSVLGVGVGLFRQVVSGLHSGLTEFIRQVVVRRREKGIPGWREWLREDPLIHPYKWLGPGLVPLLPFFRVSLILPQDVLGFLLIRRGLMRNSEKPGFPTYVWAKGGQP